MRIQRIAACIGLWLSLVLGFPSASWAILRCEALALGNDFLERRLTPHEQTITGLRAGEEALVSPLLKALEIGDWTADVFNPHETSQDSLMRAALEAYRSNQIHIEQLATVLLRWEAFEDFSPNKINEVPFRILNDEGRLTSEAENVFMEDGEYFPAIDENQKADFEKAVRKMPASERFFWRINVPTEWIVGKNKKRWASGFNAARIRKDLSIFFGKTKKTAAIKGAKRYAVQFERGTLYYYGDTQEMLVPSFSVLQAFLNVMHGPEAVKLLPEFGETDEFGVLEGMLFGGRVFALSFPEVKGLEEPDGIPMGRYITSIHDLDHAFKGSEAPEDYRKLAAHCATVLLKRAKELKKESVKSSRSYDLINMIGHTTESVLDLYLPSNDYPDERFGAKLYKDFGEHSPEVLNLLKDDMRQHAATYREMGFDPVRLIKEMENPA